MCSTFAVLSNDSHLWKGIGERTWDAESIAMQKPAHKSYKWLFECKKVNSLTALLSLPLVSPSQRHSIHQRIFEMGEIKVGKGSFVGEHNDLYQGEWKDNMRHGVGTSLPRSS